MAIAHLHGVILLMAMMVSAHSLGATLPMVMMVSVLLFGVILFTEIKKTSSDENNKNRLVY